MNIATATHPDSLHSGRCYAFVGGTGGMGLAAAWLVARQGAHVALIGRNIARARHAAETMAANAVGRVVGLGTEDGLDSVLAGAADILGGLDGLAITAGPVSTAAPLLELSDADWADCFETQLMTNVRAMRAAIPIMIAGGGGSIVTIAAHSIREPKLVLPHYGAMKTAIASVTKNVARHYGGQGIRANCIAPGTISTESLAEERERAAAHYGGDPDEALWTHMAQHWGVHVAQNRIGQPREVGELIAFLLSTQAAYLTGSLINIDGGTDF